MIDMHCHLLPGIDDGPATLERSLALARAAVAQGTTMIVATPHVSPRYPNDATTIGRALDRLTVALADAEIPLEVASGAEIAMTQAIEFSADDLAALTLGEGPWLLVECPFVEAVSGFGPVLSDLQLLGYRILLAHPERCPAFRREPAALRSFVAAGMLVSITAGSLVGQFGREVRRFTLSLFAEGLVHNVASDAHDNLRRGPSVIAELESAGLTPLADWLTVAVPEAILADGEIPQRPRTAAGLGRSRARRWWPTRR
jgi:protein-tyrosine phosphatase